MVDMLACRLEGGLPAMPRSPSFPARLVGRWVRPAAGRTPRYIPVAAMFCRPRLPAVTVGRRRRSHRRAPSAVATRMEREGGVGRGRSAFMASDKRAGESTCNSGRVWPVAFVPAQRLCGSQPFTALSLPGGGRDERLVARPISVSRNGRLLFLSLSLYFPADAMMIRSLFYRR